MADFCKQCSIALYDKDFGDLAGLCTKCDNGKGLYATVLCEGCGPIQVTWDGTCISNCFAKHREKCEEKILYTELNFTEESINLL